MGNMIDKNETGEKRSGINIYLKKLNVRKKRGG